VRVLFGSGTFLVKRSHDWGAVSAGRALCPDGVVRALQRVDGYPDAACSLPAAVVAHGKTVSGFVMAGRDALEFTPNRSGRNAGVFS
jgi:hypothetical protein